MENTDTGYLQTLAREQTYHRLNALGLSWSAQDASACAALRYVRLPDRRLNIVGLLGGASSGKSTLFNSLVGENQSKVSAHAHETLGAVLSVHQDQRESVAREIESQLLFGGQNVRWLKDRQPTEGAPDELLIGVHASDRLADTILIDLPDVTSNMSHDEGDVARSFMPWLDAVIIVVDEERWFDASIFNDVGKAVRAFGPRLATVFNHTSANEPSPEQSGARFAQIAADNGVTEFFVSPFVAGSGFRPLDTGVIDSIAHWIAQPAPAARRETLGDHVRTRCAAVLSENVNRSEAHAQLCRKIDRFISDASGDARLTYDLLTPNERRLLGAGRRFVPLYDAFSGIIRRISGRGPSKSKPVDFDKRGTELADTLSNNFELRISRAADQIKNLIDDSDYPIGDDWRLNWSTPDFDATAWSTQIGAHIDAWKRESENQARRSDAVGLIMVPPLLLADLVFLGGAGVTLFSAAAAGITGLLGGKSLAAMVHKSPAFEAYQTTVRNYQAHVRETLAEQWAKNRIAIPRRHLEVSDPIVSALMRGSTPDQRSS